MLVESIAGAPLSFHVIPWDAPRSQLTLQARSPRHKREWTLLLKRVILENYNAVIPSHARQLVMELGQNKTDDDMLAEKSHNLITQASMRKQLSAPEYLEKRKLERERRKSFENGIRGRLKKVNRKYTVPNSTTETSQDCDCAQVSVEKGNDYTCDSCYVDLCFDCEADLNKDKVKNEKCNCGNDAGDKCPECDRSLHYIDAGSAEHLERKASCKCIDFQSSQESFSKEFPNSTSLTKTRGYHSSDNIVGYTDTTKSKEDFSETNNSSLSVRNIPKTCLKCAKIKENIPVTDLGTMHNRKSRCNDSEKKQDNLRSKSKDDPQRSKLTKIATWRRKSEPGLQQNPGIVIKKSQDSDSDKNDVKGNEKIEFECRNCGSNKITRKVKINEAAVLSDPELEGKRRGNLLRPNLEIKMYNSKNIPKKISKLKKNRTKGLRLGSDTTAKFYADLSSDVSTENILHISESNDSLNVEKKDASQSSDLPDSISKDADIDEETYKKLIEKTDSFKKNELEKVKYLNKQKVINEGSEVEELNCGVDITNEGVVPETIETSEQPLEQIISQLLMQNREFQKILKKQQLRNSAQRRHQRLLKSHSNPEQVILNRNTDSLKLKPKYGRQTSENIDPNKDEDLECFAPAHEMDNVSEEDHIYETLRVENRVNKNSDPNTRTDQSAGIPRRLPSPPTLANHLPDGNIASALESDYVYLSFDKLNAHNSDGVYDVPVKSPAKVEPQQTNHYYVTMETQGPPTTDEDSLYDNLVKVRRKKDVPSNLPSEYLPMSPEQRSPNTPEIWLSRQKEHFTVSRDRKSGSLPRSFQVVTPNQEDNNLSTFKCKPNSSSKTYLNREGKVLSIDRPFTIASDQSEISYDDVENYMPDGDILKFNKNSKSNEADYVQNISQSTLELEEEIDRCYKTNFESVTLDKNKNESLVTTSQPNLNTSMTSSCELISQEQNDDKPKDIEIIHPEHKIYKPTSNMLSLKNVLSRFRNRTPNKNNEDIEINANEQGSPESIKSDPKSPTTDKRSALNPRSYSKNLLQRFRSIIGDEHPDDNQNRTELKTSKSVDESQNNLGKAEIKVVITSTDTSPTTSTIVYTINNDALSKSMYDTSTLTESQNDKNNLDLLSHSCDNITQKSEIRPSYDKSLSMVTSVSSICSVTSQTKSKNSSYQALNKLPIYMQGSKLLGARIAQSDYADPTTLASEKSPMKDVNVLINKNAVRPDSLFSNSSFVTSSSEGAYQEQAKTNDSQNNETIDVKAKPSESSVQAKSDESYYEKSFEKIEHVTDEDVFRDSAVYSDQDDNEDSKTNNSTKVANKTVLRVESIKRNASIKSQKVTVNTVCVSTINEKNSTISRTNVTTNKFQQNEPRSQNIQTNKSKIAPPVPVKPKITNIPTANMQNKSFIHRNSNFSKSQEVTTSVESNNARTIKRNLNMKTVRPESTPAKTNEVKANTTEKNDSGPIDSKEEADGLIDKTKLQGSIQMKRLSFERASLDSATRKIKTTEKRLSVEPSKVTTKSVLERRMEIEQLSRTQIAKPTNIKKPAQIAKPKSITTKVATYERSVSDNGKRDLKTPSTSFGNIPQDRNSINEPKLESDDLKGSWVKQVVNKFQ
ncbi:hypothetical protein O0L34_g18786 [Tuta absoluta]|nr:hypothetical protein O0L34_g18786 [Tuta absoluta]